MLAKSLLIILENKELLRSLLSSTNKVFALLNLAPSLPIGESSITNVFSGLIPNSIIGFQYISGWGFGFFTSSLDKIMSKSSMIPNLLKTFLTVDSILLLAQTSLIFDFLRPLRLLINSWF